MVLQLLKRALLKTRISHRVASQTIASLCERYLSLFWQMKYQEIRANYPHPVWHPHRLALATWPEHRNCHFLERGVYSNQVIAQGDTVLDMCCGDGFYSYFFFSNKAEHVDAIDIDEAALAHAQEYHSHPKISYHRSDIVKDPFPRKSYNVVIWDSAIRRLNREHMDIVFEKITHVLRPTNGVFSCYEIFEGSEKPIDFITPLTSQQLIQMLQKYFPSVQWVETVTPGRHNYYFHCYMKRGGPSRENAGQAA